MTTCKVSNGFPHEGGGETSSEISETSWMAQYERARRRQLECLEGTRALRNELLKQEETDVEKYRRLFHSKPSGSTNPTKASVKRTAERRSINKRRKGLKNLQETDPISTSTPNLSPIVGMSSAPPGWPKRISPRLRHNNKIRLKTLQRKKNTLSVTLKHTFKTPEILPPLGVKMKETDLNLKSNSQPVTDAYEKHDDVFVKSCLPRLTSEHDLQTCPTKVSTRHAQMSYRAPRLAAKETERRSCVLCEMEAQLNDHSTPQTNYDRSLHQAALWYGRYPSTPVPYWEHKHRLRESSSSSSSSPSSQASGTNICDEELVNWNTKQDSRFRGVEDLADESGDCSFARTNVIDEDCDKRKNHCDFDGDDDLDDDGDDYGGGDGDDDDDDTDDDDDDDDDDDSHDSMDKSKITEEHHENV